MRNQLRPLTALTLLATLIGCGSVSTIPATPLIPSSAAVWFHPKPTDPSQPLNGSSDFMALFQDGAPWSKSLAHTQVIGLYAGWAAMASDADLRQVVTFLLAHNLTIELEAPSLQALANCGSGVEGYVPYGQTVQIYTAAYLSRLLAINAPVAYIKVDEPFFFGAITNDSRSCNFTPIQIATEVSQYNQIVHAFYPKAQVGDVEPVIDAAYPGGVVAALDQWHQVYQNINGTPFPFVIADIDFSNSAWPALVKTLELESRQVGTAFGIIYIGDQFDTSDQEWITKAANRFQLYQGEAGGQPDFVLFQSWEPHPQHCLPESDPTTFTGLLNTYIHATT